MCLVMNKVIREKYTHLYNLAKSKKSLLFTIMILMFSGLVFTQLPIVSDMIGHKVITIVSESMEPSIMTGALIVGNSKFEKEDIKVGDVIGYNAIVDNNKILFVHRVVKIENGIYTTKGDNNRLEDPWDISYQDIQYKIGNIYNATSHLLALSDYKVFASFVLVSLLSGLGLHGLHRSLIMDNDE